MEWKDFFERIPGMLHDIKREELGEIDCAVMVLARGLEVTTCVKGRDFDTTASILIAMYENEALRNAIMTASREYMNIEIGKRRRIGIMNEIRTVTPWSDSGMEYFTNAGRLP
jgi:hypothetical protein